MFFLLLSSLLSFSSSLFLKFISLFISSSSPPPSSSSIAVLFIITPLLLCNSITHCSHLEEICKFPGPLTGKVCLRRVSGFGFGGFGLLWVLRGISEEWSGWCVCVCGRIGGSRTLRVSFCSALCKTSRNKSFWYCVLKS